MVGTPDTVLVVDDEVDLLENCRRILVRAGYQCLTAERGAQGLEIIERESPSIVLVDLRMPDMDGIEVLRHVRASSPEMPVILITAYASTQTAVKAMDIGAFDYLPKPFSSDRLLGIVTRALEFSHRRRRAADPGQPIDRCGVIGNSPRIREVVESAARTARSDANVVICGETGSGKELVARIIHRNSTRALMPFVPVDCGALTESLVETELFGHERGAYTDAKQQAPGLLELANGGVLFLDEVVEMSLSTQAKLLRALEEQQVRRVGGRELIPIDIRVIAASNKNLFESIRQGEFREDLYYRLNVVEIEVPPLRERSGDIRLLATYFLDTFRLRQTSEELCGISEAAFMILEQYRWPGNVRELRNVIERALSLSRGAYLSPSDLPEQLLGADQETESYLGEFQHRKRELVKDFESRYLRELMDLTGGNVSRAAKMAGMLRPALQRLLRKYSIDPVDYR